MNKSNQIKWKKQRNNITRTRVAINKVREKMIGGVSH